MRNLSLQGELRRRVSLSSSSVKNEATTDAAAITEQYASCFSSNYHIVDLCPVYDGNDSSSSRVILTQDGLVVRVNGENDQIAWTYSLNEICSDNDNSKGDGWFSLTCIEEDFLVCLSSNGAIVTVSPESGQAELVGEFENGIEAGVWSPDGEVLLLVTFANDDDDDDDDDDIDENKKSVLLSMNSQWEVLAEVNMENHIPSKTSGDDCKVSVCWRPDASLFAVSSVDESDSMRKIRFYKRETLELHAIGRTEDGSGKLAPNLQDTMIAWAGPGCSQVLAAIQRKGKKTQQVAFFESNGLRHREFILREDPNSVVFGLDWNVESDLIAVSIREEDCDKVQLWHRSNYYWYLKKEFRYANQKIVRAKFHEEYAYTLYVIFQSVPQWREYEFRWDTSTLLTETSTCTAFVIDGCRLNMTPLDRALVPPPMYAAVLELDFPIAQVAMSRDESSPITCVAVLSNGNVAVIGQEGSCKSNLSANYNRPGLITLAKWSMESDLDASSLRDYVIVEESNDSLRMVAVASIEGPCESLVEIMLHWVDGNAAEILVMGKIPLEERALSVVPWSDSPNNALIQLRDGQLLEYESGSGSSGSLRPSDAEPLLEPCPWIAALHDVSNLDDGKHSERKRLVIGLSSRFRLYCHDLLLTDSASSFVLSTKHEFLCYASASSRCQLRFLSLNELHNHDPLMGSDENYILEGYEPRNIERGARLVAILPQTPMAVLQMPRGNLEGVYARALFLRCAILNISGGEYKAAFEMMRRQKVDPNLIVDLDPLKFLKQGGVEAFVEQVINIDHLNLFISTLQNWDSTQARFVIPSWLRPNATEMSEIEEFDFTTKVNQTCQVLRSIMIEAEKNGKTRGGRNIAEGHFLLPILSTFAKEDPPKLGDALSLIKQNALSKHTASSKKPPLFADAAQSALQYLAFLAEYELLFETALGMYDYDVARAVARNSQMDPKVYLPLLKRFRELPLYYGRFEVDVRLKRFESALRNLYESGSRQESLDEVKDVTGNGFEQCMDLINDHQLHRLGLELFQSEGQRRLILVSLGDYVMEQKQAATALNIFLLAEPMDIERAKGSARLCRDWKTFFALVSKETNTADVPSEVETSKRLLLAREVADELAVDAEGHVKRRDMLSDAARILLDYGNDTPGAVEMLLQAELWNEGQRIARLSSREDLVQKCVDAATSYAHSTMTDLQERTDAFCTANSRYSKVLTIRKEAIANGDGELVGANETVDDDGSLFSAASNASNLSMASSMSTASTGSISSVISVKSTTSFTLSGADERNRHKSKFNQLGGRPKTRRKKKGKGRTKIRPGSEQELQGLVQTMRSNCVDASYRDIVAETITFLARVGKKNISRSLYDSYIRMSESIQASQDSRIEKARQEKFVQERKARREGRDSQEEIVHAVEREVDSMSCAALPGTLHELFSFIPASLCS